jgi:hypothetical protein
MPVAALPYSARVRRFFEVDSSRRFFEKEEELP